METAVQKVVDIINICSHCLAGVNILWNFVNRLVLSYHDYINHSNNSV